MEAIKSYPHVRFNLALLRQTVDIIQRHADPSLDSGSSLARSILIDDADQTHLQFDEVSRSASSVSCKGDALSLLLRTPGVSCRITYEAPHTTITVEAPTQARLDEIMRALGDLAVPDYSPFTNHRALIPYAFVIAAGLFLGLASEYVMHPAQSVIVNVFRHPFSGEFVGYGLILLFLAIVATAFYFTSRGFDWLFAEFFGAHPIGDRLKAVIAAIAILVAGIWNPFVQFEAPRAPDSEAAAAPVLR